MADTPLATVDDVVARLGRTLDSTEDAKVSAVLADASAAVRRWTGKRLSRETTTDTVRIVNGKVRLPQTPVNSITTVALATGTTGAPISTLGYAFDGIDTIWGIDTSLAVTINLPEILHEQTLNTAKVTYDHGYTTIPEDIVSVVCSAAIRALSNPAAPGLISETIDTYSYRAETPSGMVLLTVDEKETLRPYRRQVSSVVLR